MIGIQKYKDKFSFFNAPRNTKCIIINHQITVLHEIFKTWLTLFINKFEYN